MGKAARAKRERRETMLSTLENLDGHSGLRNALRLIAEQIEEWAGIPMPLKGERLVIEPTYQYAKLAEIGTEAEPEREPDPKFDGAKIRNRWWSMEQRAWIVVFEYADGRIDWGKEHGIHHFLHDLKTLGCMDAWGIEQESRAVQLLASLVRHRQFKQYMLTGMFLETSKRSGVTYMFRRLKPTVAMTPRGRRHLFGSPQETMKILCALCMHPIAYYSGSWAGAMCPTDDVIAHLQMMRGDEHMFWKRANHHPAWLPEAGL